MTSLQSTLLVVSLVITVIIVVGIIFCCALKKRLSRRSNSHQQDCPDTQEHPSRATELAELQFSDEEFQRRVIPPPSYEEAERCSLSNNVISIPPPSVGPNADSTDAEAYDLTGLPSYNEALRISQLSLNRA